MIHSHRVRAVRVVPGKSIREHAASSSGVWKDASVSDAMTRLGDVLRSTDATLRTGGSAAPSPWATGFSPLDQFLGGGVRPGELVLLGGPQGLGKTTFVLQVAREVMRRGHPVLYVSYEHDATTVLERLLALEAGESAGYDAPDLRELRGLLESADGDTAPLLDRLARRPGGAEAVVAVQEYADRLEVLRAGGSTDVSAIVGAVASTTLLHDAPPLVIVDYVQKVADRSELGEDERMVSVVGALKDLALDAGVPVIVVAASDSDGIATGRRMRIQHLRGASALAYEADVILLLNEKYDVVARHHLVYGAANVDRFKAYAVLTIEKNRGGLDKVDMEFRKRFDQARFERDGKVVEEQLVDERLYVE